jgi:hypothetical protein
MIKDPYEVERFEGMWFVNGPRPRMGPWDDSVLAADWCSQLNAVYRAGAESMREHASAIIDADEHSDCQIDAEPCLDCRRIRRLGDRVRAIAT